MQTRKLGWTDLELTTIGLGTWAMGGGDWTFGWGAQDDAESILTLRRALELGVNWLDTAPVYGLGRSEEVVGAFLRSLPRNRRPIVATKFSRHWDEEKNLYGRLKRADVLAEADASLRRLGVDVIDLYQMHRPDPEEDLEEGWSTVAELIRKGKVRYGGVSNLTVAQMERIGPIHPIASLQPPYSLLRRGIEKDLLPYCTAHDIGVIIYSPMRKGLLTDKLTRDWVNMLPHDDHRRSDPDFQDPKLSQHVDLVDGLKRIAAKSDLTVAQLAIAWTLRRSEVTAAIVGARRPSQIEQTAGAASVRLTESQLNEIDHLLQRVGVTG